MLHLYAALAEKERRLISEGEGGTGDQEGKGEQADNPIIMRKAGDIGRATLAGAADDPCAPPRALQRRDDTV
jgi:hypothetical protein